MAEVQEQRINIAAKLGDDERHPLGQSLEMSATSRDSRSSVATMTVASPPAPLQVPRLPSAQRNGLSSKRYNLFYSGNA